MQGKVWYGTNSKCGVPDLSFENGRVWRNGYAVGEWHGSYSDAEVFDNGSCVQPNCAVCKDGGIWFHRNSSGFPDASYEGGKIWDNSSKAGIPHSLYEGEDVGAGAAWALERMKRLR